MKNNNEKVNIKDLILDDNFVKPNEISEEIIENIKEIQFATLTIEESKTLIEVVKETLRRVKLYSNNHELALIYDMKGFVNQYGQWLYQENGETDTDYIYLGKNSDVYHILNDRESVRAVVISHNHPNNRVISLMDIRALAEMKNIKIIVAVTNSGKYSYIVKDNFNEDMFNKILKEIAEEIEIMNISNVNEKNDIALYKLLNRCNKCGLIYKEEK